MKIVSPRLTQIGTAPWETASRPLDFLARIRWQLVVGLLVTVGAPALVRWPGSVFDFTAASLNNALVAAALAMLAGYVAVRRLAIFPGMQVVSLVLPAFCASYGVMAVMLLLVRADYSRYQLLASFLLALVFFTYALVVERRVKRPRLAIVPQGGIDRLFESDRVDWSLWPSAHALPSAVDGVVADLRADLGDGWQEFLARCALEGIPVYHCKQVYEALTGRVDIEHLSENSLGSLSPSSLYLRAKRAIDFAAAVLALPLVLPMLAVIAILIKRDSPGPVFFTQDRMGYRGRPFTIWKLRTMVCDRAGAAYTEGEDPRVTRLGRFLRTYRIDELPQILNVLKGEMSWIGPRPEAVELSAWYQRELGFYSYRHIVRPGITGWAQVHQGWAALPEQVRYKLHYDFYYIKHFSPWLDVLIAVQTVRTVCTGFGAR